MFNAEELQKAMASMQEQAKAAQEKMQSTTLSAKAGGGLVSVSASGEGQIIDITIDDSLLEDKESLQILLMSAVNDVLKSVEENKKEAAMGLLGGFGGLGNLNLGNI